jgi:Z1 domain
MLFYEDLADRRRDPDDLRKAVAETITRLREAQTDVNHPGMLLGKVQSGKTRAFLGVMAACFDDGYQGIIVLTKGTKTLAIQTLARIDETFGGLRDRDECQIFDILEVPARLSPFERNQRIILVSKKEDDNLRALLELFTQDYPEWRDRRWLIIDDEADFASITFRKNGVSIDPGTINRQIEDLREVLTTSQFLEVTATPYSLYLQPEEGMVSNGIPIMRPRKPRFTVVLPTHDAYVGGEYYFEHSLDETSPASHFYEEVPTNERDILKLPDRRSFKIEEALTSPRITVLRRAIMNFIVGVTARRLQERSANTGEPLPKYSFVVHTERSTASHDWQLQVVDALWQGFVGSVDDGSETLRKLVGELYEDIASSIALTGTAMPSFDIIFSDVVRALRDGELLAEKVNCENDILALLDKKSGQLRLRAPMNLFIGGQILDRGITIHNLVGFYYGRNPQRSQQDTVLQHSRMYGARFTADLGITRLYAPRDVYSRMRKIHELDATLRDALLRGDHEQGVYFVETDDNGRVLPCAPNKLLISNIYTLRPGHRMTPTGFTTVALSRGQGRLRELDAMIARLTPDGSVFPMLVTVFDAVALIELAFANLEFAEEIESRGYKAAMMTVLRWFAKGDDQTQIHLIAATGRDVSRLRDGNRLSNSPTTKQQHDLAANAARTSPVLYLMRQSGTVEKGWRDLAFWWPVVQVPNNTVPALYAVN